MRFFIALILTYTITLHAANSEDYKAAINEVLASRNLDDEALKQIAEELFIKLIDVEANYVGGSQPATLNIKDENYVFDYGLNRRVRSLTLGNYDVKSLRNVRFSLSLPENFDENKKYPVLFVMPGFNTPKNVIQYVGNVGEMIVVGYEYFYQNADVFSVFRMNMAQEIAIVPVQVSAALNWLKSQSYVNADKISLFGVSLGGMLLPASQRFAQMQGTKVHSSVIAYAPADVQKALIPEIEKNVSSRNDAKHLAELLKVFLYPILPEVHAQYLQSNILYVNGSHDEYFSPKMAKKLYDSLPSPKEQAFLDSGHIHAGDTDAISQLVNLTKDYLTKTGAL